MRFQKSGVFASGSGNKFWLKMSKLFSAQMASSIGPSTLRHCCCHGERRVEGVGIFDRDEGGQGFAVRADGEALDHMQLLGVGRTEIVDVAVLGGQSDGVDDESIAVLVMADGFTEPGWLHFVRMLVGQPDAPDHLVALPHHGDDVFFLDEIDRLEREQQLPRHTAGIAACLGSERHLTDAGECFFIRVEHEFRSPGLQHRVFRIADAKGWLRAGAARFCVAVEGVRRVRCDGAVAGARGRVLPIGDVGLPAEIGRSEIGDFVLRRRLGERRGQSQRESAARQRRPDSQCRHALLLETHPYRSQTPACDAREDRARMPKSRRHKFKPVKDGRQPRLTSVNQGLTARFRDKCGALFHFQEKPKAPSKVRRVRVWQ